MVACTANGVGMKVATLVLAALSLVAAPAAADPWGGLPVRTIYTIKQTGGGLGVMVEQIVVVQLAGGGDADQAWFVEQRRHDVRMGKSTFRHQWIDGRKCPALAGVLAAIGKLPPIGFAGPDNMGAGWRSDTPYVTLMGPPADHQLGEVVLRRDLSGPVSQWWWSAEKTLEPCWQDNLILFRDGSVFPKLGSDEAAVAAGKP